MFRRSLIIFGASLSLSSQLEAVSLPSFWKRCLVALEISPPEPRTTSSERAFDFIQGFPFIQHHQNHNSEAWHEFFLALADLNFNEKTPQRFQFKHPNGKRARSYYFDAQTIQGFKTLGLILPNGEWNYKANAKSVAKAFERETGWTVKWRRSRGPVNLFRDYESHSKYGSRIVKHQIPLHDIHELFHLAFLLDPLHRELVETLYKFSKLEAKYWRKELEQRGTGVKNISLYPISENLIAQILESSQSPDGRMMAPADFMLHPDDEAVTNTPAQLKELLDRWRDALKVKAETAYIDKMPVFSLQEKRRDRFLPLIDFVKAAVETWEQRLYPNFLFSNEATKLLFALQTIRIKFATEP